MGRGGPWGRSAAILAAVAVVGLGAGCSSSKESSSRSSGDFAAAAPPNAQAGSTGGSTGGLAAGPAAPQGADSGAAAGKSDSSTSGQNALSKAPVAGRSLVYTATLTVRTKDVASATASAEQLAAANGGFVGDEKSESGTVPDVQGLTQSTVTLRVPSTAFDSVLDKLGTGGVVQDETRSASDVTSQVVDTTTRIAAQQASIARITDLMKNAGSLSDVVSLEGELSRREADLESMQAQLAALNDQVSLSTITVTYLVPEAPSATPPVPKKQNALQRGLHDGWVAFLGVVKVLMILFGVVLPFLVLFVVLWWPVTRGVRFVRRHSGSVPAARVAAAEAPVSAGAPAAPAVPVSTVPAGRADADTHGDSE